MSLSAKKFVEESRRKLRESNQKVENGKITLQIFESPTKLSPRISTPSHCLKLQDPEKYITLKCEEGEEILLPEPIAFCSALIKRMFVGGKFKESISRVVDLPYPGELIEKIFKYCMEDYLINKGRPYSRVKRALFQDDFFDNFDDDDHSQDISLKSYLASHSPANPPKRPRTFFNDPQKKIAPRVVLCVEITPNNVMALISACHYLEIPELLETACKMIAHNIDCLETLSGIPIDVVHMIYSYLSPEKLLEMENSSIHKKYELLRELNTSDLWRNAAMIKGWSPFELICSHYFCWSNEERETLPLIDYKENQNTDEFFIQEFDQHFSDCSWRSLYQQKIFQEKLLSFSSICLPSKNNKKRRYDFNSLLSLLSQCSPEIRSLEIPPNFFSVSGLNTFKIAAMCPNLKYINITDHTINQESMKALVDLLQSGKVPHVQSLVLSRASLKDEVCSILLSFLATQNKNASNIKRLDLSENRLTSSSLETFAEILTNPDCCIQNLSLRDNALALKTSPWVDSEDEEESAFSNLLSSLKCNNTIRLLDLSHNELHFGNLPQKALEDISENKSLVYLLLNHNRLIGNNKSIQAFNTFMNNLPKNLAHLNLSNVGIGSEQVQAINNACIKTPSLRNMNLSHNMLGPEGCDVLAQLLRNNNTLKSLDLSSNHIWQSGALLLCSSLGMNTSLLSFNLSSNMVGSSALELAQACQTNSKTMKLRQLNLGNNNIPEDIRKQIKELLVGTEISAITI